MNVRIYIFWRSPSLQVEFMLNRQIFFEEFFRNGTEQKHLVLQREQVNYRQQIAGPADRTRSRQRHGGIKCRSPCKCSHAQEERFKMILLPSVVAGKKELPSMCTDAYSRIRIPQPVKVSSDFSRRSNTHSKGGASWKTYE